MSAARVRMTKPGEEWLTIGDVGEELGVSKMTVYRLVPHFRLRAYLFGRSFRVERADLETYKRGAVYGGEAS